MTLSPENDRQRYAQELAAYTLRQFAAVRSSAVQLQSTKRPISIPEQKHHRRTSKAPGTLGDLGNRKGVTVPTSDRGRQQQLKKRFFIP